MAGLKLLGAAVIEGLDKGCPLKLLRMPLPFSRVLGIGFVLLKMGVGDLFEDDAMFFLENPIFEGK